MDNCTAKKEDPSNCHGCALCGHGLLAGASSAAISAWNEAKKIRNYPRGATLFREGEPSQGLYCTYSGLIKLYRASLHGEIQIVRLITGLHVVGHRSLLAQEPMSATAVALRDTRLCFVDRLAVANCLRLDSTLAVNLACLLARELGQAESRLFSLSCHNTRARLARLLLEIRQDNGFAVELTRVEMGQIIGVSPESVSRALQGLSRAGALRLVKRKIALEDPQILEDCAHDPRDD
ncbi:Crp/Fnr family transcriptional regulator [bacterium]|nr:Crp/Fnr family transcriptional regulator [bacterium]